MNDRDTGAYDYYSMILEWDPNDRIYVVTVPELPGCQTHGSTLEEAVQQGRDAYESWVDVARELGRPVPPARIFKPEAAGATAGEPAGVR
jgi:predicted RNase H-like HicB family nuclease